ncbi:hypothetical protein VTI28DRAFT_747 [Corynascus sepedonium]
MGKSKMDDAAAERIRRARGDKDGFTKRAAEAARRNVQSSSSSSHPRDLSFSSFSPFSSFAESGGYGGGNVDSGVVIKTGQKKSGGGGK